VPLTSDGRNTVRGIVTVRNGVETFVTETIEEIVGDPQKYDNRSIELSI
jgi:hypothetical protein